MNLLRPYNHDIAGIAVRRLQFRTAVKTVNDQDEPVCEAGQYPGIEPDAPLSDDLLLDLLDALVNDRGPTGAAEALGVNYRTVSRCQQSRRVTRRMREVLAEFRDAPDAGDDGPGVGVGDGVEDGAGESRHGRMAELEQENRELRETVEAQAEELEALRRRVAEQEERWQPQTGDDVVEGGQGHPEDWRPPRRRPGLPDAGVVTLDEQPDDEHAFGPAAPLVAEWRRVRLAGQTPGSRVEWAVAAVRRWELEVEMLRDFHLTLPPETDPLDGSRRKDHVRWREEALAEARRELGRAKRARLLRRVLTLGLWRK